MAYWYGVLAGFVIMDDLFGPVNLERKHEFGNILIPELCADPVSGTSQIISHAEPIFKHRGQFGHLLIVFPVHEMAFVIKFTGVHVLFISSSGRIRHLRRMLKKRFLSQFVTLKTCIKNIRYVSVFSTTPLSVYLPIGKTLRRGLYFWTSACEKTNFFLRLIKK